MGAGPYRGARGPGDSPGDCPRCPGTLLEPRAAGQLSVAFCRRCRGIWIGESSYLDVFFAASEDLAHLARADAASAPYRVKTGDASCPACGVIMEAHGGTTGVTIDVCARHGFWLDAGELGHLLGATDEPAGLLDRLTRWLFRDGA